MRWLLLGLCLVLGLGFLVFAVEMIAAENGEVIVLRTRDESGRTRDVRLWVVDEGDRPWVRAGHGRAGWLESLRESPDVEIVRDGITTGMRAVPDTTARDRVNALMAEKYGWAELYTGLLFSREESIPVRLEPL